MENINGGFNALRALGYFSTEKWSSNLLAWRRFNALRALGYFSTYKVEVKAQGYEVFQCTSCFGVLLNQRTINSVYMIVCFNALRALGYFSTRNSGLFIKPAKFVSMHFVLWGTSQHLLNPREEKVARVSMHFVLWGTSQRDAIDFYRKQGFKFQCTSCFGVLLNQNYFSY